MSLPSDSSIRATARAERARSRYVGTPVQRIEDPTLLTGRGRYTDDVPVPRGTLHAAILRSPHAHAEIRGINVGRAEALPGVVRVLTGHDIKAHTAPFLTVVKERLDEWCLAVDRVRFFGEAVAVVIADDRYIAEDAFDLIEVDYRPLAVVIDPIAATRNDAPLLHEAAGSNVPSDREFIYGDPATAFAKADRVVELTTNYPRNSHTPLEGFVVVANYDPEETVYDVVSNFQGPFTVHPVMARALKVPGSHLRMRTPPYSGGAFGVKQAIFPYVVLCCIAAKLIGRPVKWVEDQFEHLTAATAAPNRVVNLRAAATKDGRVTALDYEQLDDYGAYVRPPMPGPLYRQHGVMTGPYDIPNIRIRNRMVMTNKTPSGMVRGFGGPQAFFALERVMHRVAIELNVDPLDVIRKNLVPKSAFPYRAAAGALLDSGDYQAVVDKAVREGDLDELYRRREQARKEGRWYGIGMAACSDPAHSNMGYLSTIQTVEDRHRSGHKGGNISYATVNVEPLGTVNVAIDSIPQGQGHATVVSQIVADELGIPIDRVKVNQEHDTHKDPWSIATGNYSCRFSSASAIAVLRAARAVRGKLARIAQQQLNVSTVDEIEFADGMIFARDNPENALKFHRVAGKAHWQPGELPEGMEPGIREVATFTPPELLPPNDLNQINTSLTYGFVFDFCGVEIDRDTGQVRIDKYVTSHDSGTILNPLILMGQVYGAFAWAVGCALTEEFAYSDDGQFLSATFADYLVPTVHEVPVPQVLHTVTPTPFTELGAKGGAEGNVMSTPACLANAVCDALGIDHIDLPMAPAMISRIIHRDEPPPPGNVPPASASTGRAASGGRVHTGDGRVTLPATPQVVWDILVDPQRLARIIPGCKELKLTGNNQYKAVVTLGAGPIKGEFETSLELAELDPPNSVVLSGSLVGPLGASEGRGNIRLQVEGGRTVLSYDYEVRISGKIAAIGARMLDGSTRIIIRQFFARLIGQLGNEGPSSFWRRVLRTLGRAS